MVIFFGDVLLAVTSDSLLYFSFPSSGGIYGLVLSVLSALSVLALTTVCKLACLW